MTSTFAFIFARGGSKGLPRKNILSICGTPMLAYSIKTARELHAVDRIYVSTDCDEIASIAFQYGAEVILRPAELASDTASEWLAWQHAINFVLDSGHAFDCFLSLPATAPMRKPEDVQRCLDALHEDIDFVNEGVKIHIKRSKTDQTGIGMIKAIPYFENRIYCPVVSLKTWIN